MRKYMEIAKIHLKMQLIWRADVLFNMLFTVSRILFAYLLWKIIFADKEIVAGFNFNSMLSYYIINSFLTQLDMSSGISEEISSKIRNGTFSKYIVIPVNIEGYFVAMEIGKIVFYLFFDLIAAVVWIFLFNIEFVFAGNIVNILCAVIMVLFGMFFMVQLNYFLGLLTLRFEEISTFLMIKNNLLALVTGSIIPLVLLPESVVEIMKLLPFYYVTYLPSMLFIGRCGNEAVKGVVIITGWCIVMQLLIKLTWNRYIRKYDGVGI
ncbi:MAG: ABC transporter permease [Coprococcus sp.]